MLTLCDSAKDLVHPAVADLGVQVVRVDVVRTLLEAGLEAGTNIVGETGALVLP